MTTVTEDLAATGRRGVGARLRRWGPDPAAWGGALLAVALLLGLWFALSGFGIVSDRSLASPGDIFSRATSEWRETLDYLGKTMARVGIGYVIGCIAGFVLALATASMPWLFRLLEPAVQVARSVPPFVLAPFVILWFGYRPIGPVLFVAWTSFFIVYIETIEAVKNVRLEYRWAAAALGASRLRSFREVVLPSVTPDVIGGLRVAVVTSVNMAVLIEFLSSSGGIGYMLIRGYTFFRLDVLLLAIIVAVVATLVIDQVVARIGRYAVRWAE